MPTSPARLCNGCGGVVRGKCPTCSSAAWSTSTRRGSTRRSRKLRAQMLAEQPLCAWPDCAALATQDDHIIGWSQRKVHGMTEEQWDHRDNHQGLCKTHHDEKTALEARVGRGHISPGG